MANIAHVLKTLEAEEAALRLISGTSRNIDGDYQKATTWGHAADAEELADRILTDPELRRRVGGGGLWRVYNLPLLRELITRMPWKDLSEAVVGLRGGYVQTNSRNADTAVEAILDRVSEERCIPYTGGGVDASAGELDDAGTTVEFLNEVAYMVGSGGETIQALEGKHQGCYQYHVVRFLRELWGAAEGDDKWGILMRVESAPGLQEALENCFQAGDGVALIPGMFNRGVKAYGAGSEWKDLYYRYGAWKLAGRGDAVRVAAELAYPGEGEKVGDVEAFAEVVKQGRKPVFRILEGVGEDGEDDVVQGFVDAVLGNVNRFVEDGENGRCVISGRGITDVPPEWFVGGVINGLYGKVKPPALVRVLVSLTARNTNAINFGLFDSGKAVKEMGVKEYAEYSAELLMEAGRWNKEAARGLFQIPAQDLYVFAVSGSLGYMTELGAAFREALLDVAMRGEEYVENLLSSFKSVTYGGVVVGEVEAGVVLHYLRHGCGGGPAGVAEGIARNMQRGSSREFAMIPGDVFTAVMRMASAEDRKHVARMAEWENLGGARMDVVDEDVKGRFIAEEYLDVELSVAAGQRMSERKLRAILAGLGLELNVELLGLLEALPDSATFRDVRDLAAG